MFCSSECLNVRLLFVLHNLSITFANLGIVQVAGTKQLEHIFILYTQQFLQIHRHCKNEAGDLTHYILSAHYQHMVFEWHLAPQLQRPFFCGGRVTMMQQCYAMLISQNDNKNYQIKHSSTNCIMAMKLNM